MGSLEYPVQTVLLPACDRGRTLGIDPGPQQSGVVEFDGQGRKVDRAYTWSNQDLYRRLEEAADTFDFMAIEWVEHYGMPVGRDVFETCGWIGRFESRFGLERSHRVSRREIKLHLCGSSRAKDANVRQSLIDLIGPVGRKKSPGPTYGVTGHCWSALGVVATFLRLADQVEAR